MALPKIQDLITYVSKVITGSDWNTNWQTVVSWLSSGNTDIKVKSIELSASGGIVNNGSLTQAGNVSIGGNLAVTGSVTGSTFTGDGSGLTGIVSAATVAYTPFCANSGNIDSNGLADILYYTGSTGTLEFKVGGTLPAYDNLKATSAQGSTFELSQILDLDVSSYDDGTYAVCVKKNQTVAELRGTIYIQTYAPAGNNGDLWFDISREGVIAYEKISGSWANEYEGAPIGTVTVASGLITAVSTNQYNQNYYNVNVFTPKSIYQKVGMTSYALDSLVSGSQDTVYGPFEKPYVVIIGSDGATLQDNQSWCLQISNDSGSSWKNVVGYRESTGSPESKPLFTVVIDAGLSFRAHNTSTGVYKWDVYEYAPLYPDLEVFER